MWCFSPFTFVMTDFSTLLSDRKGGKGSTTSDYIPRAPSYILKATRMRFLLYIARIGARNSLGRVKLHTK